MPTAYATPADLVDEFGAEELIDLTDRRQPRTHELDADVAQRACDRVAAEIDSHLSGRYKLPLSAMPTVLPFIARDMARFYLYEGEPPGVVKTRYDAARQMLRDIQAGKQFLGVDEAGTELADTATDLPQFEPGAKDWGRTA
jgi:phage gp36-like protein